MKLCSLCEQTFRAHLCPEMGEGRRFTPVRRSEHVSLFRDALAQVHHLNTLVYVKNSKSVEFSMYDVHLYMNTYYYMAEKDIQVLQH